MQNQAEIEKINQTILALEAQRETLGEEVVETALAPLRARLANLKAGEQYEQRKLATVLFADLVGFTALSAQMDPEDMRELLNAYFDRCRMSIERHGGVVEKFIGDAVMAVFGLPTSREDDPERAIHAGLEITQVLEQLEGDIDLSPEISLATRVGINTGEVVVGALGERQEDEFVVVGEAVNLASRLQSAAPPGSVLITHDTYRHVRGVFEVQMVEPLHLKGVSSPVQAYLVKAAKPRAFRMVRRGVEGVETRVVGREAELIRLKEAFEQVVQDRHIQVLTVVGEAGIGKSRLMAEFEDWLELLPQKVYYFKGRAHPSWKTTPYSLVRDIFAFRFQIQDSDPPPAVRQKLEQGYTQAFPSTRARKGGEEEHHSNERAAHFLGRLLGFEFGPSEHLAAAEQDARGLHDQALVYLRDFFAALGNDNPVVMLLEDLHWADDSSLDLIHQMERSLGLLPLLVVGATRPSLFERRLQWGEGLPFHYRLALGPISRRDSRALVEQILHKVEDLPQRLIDLVVRAAEGNPFYIEELLKMLIEDGVIRTQEARWQVESERLAEIRVPPTLMGVLQARFDSLQAEERSYLQRGSVIGRVFWDKAIEFLDEAAEGDAVRREPAYPELPGKLQAREIIFERENSTFEDTRE
jgi:class 3 adenylate cyclase